MCELCAGVGDVAKAYYVDHITPILQGGSKWSEDNLQALCKRCHAIKSAKDKKT